MSVKGRYLQKDFDTFVNEEWYRRNKIPDDLPEWSSVLCLRMEMVNRLRTIIHRLPLKDPPSIFYRSAMKRKGGLRAIQRRYIDQLKKLGERDELIRFLAKLHEEGVPGFINVGVYANMDQPKRYSFHVTEGGIGLSMNYYLKKKYSQIRKNYINYIAQQLKILKVADRKAKARKIFAIERSLASWMIPPQRRREVELINNRFTRRDLKKDFFLNIYLEELPNVNEVIINNPSYLQKLSQMIEKDPLDNLKLYLYWRIVNTLGRYQSREMEEERYRFYQRYLQGIKKKIPRWKSIVNLTSSFFDVIIGKKYIANFDPKEKTKVKEIAQNIRDVFRKEIEDLKWLQRKTKQSARKKLDSMLIEVAYPSHWQKGERPILKGINFIDDLAETNRYFWRKGIRRLGKKIDRREWTTPVFTVNAFYEPYLNRMTIPAGILQRPFYYKNKDNDPNIFAMNYGSLGRMIGHEMTHGFDDEGRKYDHRGVVADWWSPKDRDSFQKKVKKMISLYDKAEDGVKIDGRLTVGENIADMGGMKLAWLAYRKGFRDEFKNLDPTMKINNRYSPDQLFFISYARSKRQISRKEYLKMILTQDPHAPPAMRVNMVLSQFPPFHQTFNIKDHSKMYLAKDLRPEIW